MSDIPLTALCSAYLVMGVFIGWLAEGVAIGLGALSNLVFKFKDKKKARDDFVVLKFAPQGSTMLEIYKEHPEYFSYTEDDK